MPQKDSSEANESPLKEVSPGGFSSNMKDSPTFVIVVDCLVMHLKTTLNHLRMLSIRGMAER